MAPQRQPPDGAAPHLLLVEKSHDVPAISGAQPRLFGRPWRRLLLQVVHKRQLTAIRGSSERSSAD